MMCKL